MRNLYKYFSNLKFEHKTNFLLFTLSFGMFTIIVLSLISIYIIRDNFDKLFYEKIRSLIQLQNLEEYFEIHIKDTLNEFEKGNITYQQSEEIIDIAKELINKNWQKYKDIVKKNSDKINFIQFVQNLTKSNSHYKNEPLKQSMIENIDKKILQISKHLSLMQKQKNISSIHNINFNVNSITTYIGSLINYDLTLSISEKQYTDKIFDIYIIFSFVAIFFIIALTLILSTLITIHFRKLHNLQEKAIEKKTKKLKRLNKNLELKIASEVAKNRRKDIIMFQQARFASLGEMLNNIAHQWRQPLGSIIMIIQSFKTKMSLNKLSAEFIDKKVCDALLLAQNMSDTLDDFKNFFSPNISKKEFYVKDCIEHSLELSKYFLLKESIRVDLKVKKDAKIKTFYNELSHVFLNIIQNSKDALVNTMKKKDRIIKIILESYKGYIFVKIIDNGGGIDSAVLPKIFEPYYTTKYKSAGTGIGLYMSKQIIEKHISGKISCKNIKFTQNNKTFLGVSFTIKIPINKWGGEKND